ncbi:MAG: NTP transferase domain-containing protein [Saprospiraceae bacterium]|nr:NTP transferase domain-containing protein [Saprospiraceae bacterium]MCB9324734.1 NTP transferase domain-containing protein [Lewinellaceae bacterium]
MQHQKHTKLSRPNHGTFARNEWAIIGTPCSNIKSLAFELTQRLSAKYKVAYVDADHKGAEEENIIGRDKNSVLAFGGKMEYTDKITFHRVDFEGTMDSFLYRQWFNDQDLVLVNGNHFTAKNQIVVIDPKKEASLQKKLDRLENVSLLLLTEGQNEIYPFLRDHLKDRQVPVLSIADTDAIADFIHQQMELALPKVYGLVLAGGKSTRMGQDKGLIDYHGKPQREFAADLLKPYCEQVFISCREDQLHEIDSAYELLPDTFTGLGPYGAILSAFRAYPDHAWLVIACDLPLLNQETIAFLLKNRNESKTASAFISPVNQFPEPLIAIWEPKAYPVLFQFLAQGYSCPRKVLINSDVKLLNVPDEKTLINVNEKADLEKISTHLSRT